ncbi:MAG: peptide ABC transporter substrate-binding protein [Desulfobacterales bacterium]|nr:peptide ABC transporter substrate-binding protein [Desulfobacterales bacterium]
MSKKGFILMKTAVVLLGIMVFAVQFSPVANAAGHLRVGWTADEALESLRVGESWQYETMGCMWWQLVYDQTWVIGGPPDYPFVPWAVESFETADQQKYKYTIRENYTFHDGKPVTSKDLVFTMKYLHTSDPVWDYPDTHADNDSFVIIDDKTFEFSMKNPFGGKYPPFNWYPILPEHIWRRWKFKMLEYDNAKAIGSGPFKLVEFKPAQYMIFERHDGHWNKEPRVDKITFKTYGSSDAKNMALRRDEIDMIGYSGVSPLTVKYFEKDENIKMITSDGIGLSWLTFNHFMTDNGMSDLTVRRAIVHAIDKNRINEIVYHKAAVVHDSFIYPELPEYNKNLPQYEFDQAKSRKMLDEAGYVDTDGDDIRNVPSSGKNMSYRFLISSDDAEHVKMGAIIREQLKPVGIDIKLNVVDYNTYGNLYYVPDEKRFDIAIGMEEPGPYADWVWEFMRSYDDGGYGWNSAGYDNPEFDKALNAYAKELDMEKRFEYQREMQFMMQRDLPHYVILRANIYDPVRIDKLDGYVQKMGGISTWINPFSYFFVHAK